MERHMRHYRAAAIAAATIVAAGCGGYADSQAVDAAAVSSAAHPALLHGRVTTVDGQAYRGRLRFGGDEEAFWGDYFNGRKDENPWIAHMPPGARPRQGVRLAGIRIGADAAAVRRPFMARMGDIAKLEARGRNLWVTMKSGTVHHLNRYAADDFADGLRIWDPTHGVVDLDEGRIRTIEFEAAPAGGAEPPYRLHGTVRTRHEGVFTGFIEWGRKGSLPLDDLHGRTAAGEQVRLPFVTVRSISRLSGERALVTLLDGRELVLSDSRHVGDGSRGIYVDDARFGRVLVSWNALDHADFTPVGVAAGDSGPAYGAFPAGVPLAGTVSTAGGRQYRGRIVFDLDESEITETLDAPSQGVDYTLPFERVASIVLPGGGRASGAATVVLSNGERLELERAGDLGPYNGGLLIFTGAGEAAEYVPWRHVVRIDFDTQTGR